MRGDCEIFTEMNATIGGYPETFQIFKQLMT